MIRKIVLTLFLFSLGIGTAYCSQLGNYADKLFASFGYPRDKTVWGEIRRNMELPSAENRPLVKKQIRWYQHHKHYLKEVMENSAPYIHYVYQQTRKKGVPSEMALMPMIESEYNPFAYSRVGATGLWQMMPGTASGFGLKINWWYDGRRDIVASTKTALQYLKYLHQFFQDEWFLSIAAYDCGEGRVQRALRHNRRRGKSVNIWQLPLPQETQRYLPKLMAVKAIIEHPSRYGFQLPRISGKPFLKQVHVKSQIDLAAAAKLAGVSLARLRDLNPGFRRWATDPDGPYTLMVPRSKARIFKKRLAKLPRSKRVTWRRYSVKKGNTLSHIAGKFNTKNRIIRRVNHLKSSKLQVGQNLLIPVAYHGSINSPVIKHKRAIEESQVPGPKRRHYTVKPGDSLWNIAARFNVSVREIRFWNNLSHHQKIRQGNELILWLPKHSHPSHSNHTIKYAVKPGDTLGGLAQRYNTTVRHLKRINHLHSDLIHRGQRLTVPVEADAPNQATQTGQSPVRVTRSGLKYEVQPGDALVKIGRRYHVSTQRIKRSNHLKNSVIQEGQILKIPNPHQSGKHWRRHKVRPGEFLSSIARRFHVTVQQLRRWNLIDKDEYIHPGQKLVALTKH